MFTLPSHCVCCGAYLKGGATVHRPGCPIGELIEDLETGQAKLSQLSKRATNTAQRKKSAKHVPRKL